MRGIVLASGDFVRSNILNSMPLTDPRRFTPTLHANLVSEILARRRDLEERDKTIDALQADLHEQRGVHEQYESDCAIAAKEYRSLQRELEVLKGGNSHALSSLVQERDVALDATSDYKNRLEAALKRIRSLEDTENRTQKIIDQDRDNWEEERRKQERKDHVVEVRNNARDVCERALLDEIASLQSIIQNGLAGEMENSTKDPETASVRTMSLTNSIRFSMLAGQNGSPVKPNGVSLADELNFDDDDDEDLQSEPGNRESVLTMAEPDGRESVLSMAEPGGRESVLSMAHKRNHSRESVIFKGHRRNQSHESLRRPGSIVGIVRGRLLAYETLLERPENGIKEVDETPKIEYVDTGIQFSPPPSPKMQAIAIVSVIEPVEASEPPPSSKIQAIEIVSIIEPVEYLESFTPMIVNIPAPMHGKRQSELAPREWEREIEANQRRKRVHATPALTIETPNSSSMVSSASQTLEGPLSPPRTPISPTRAPPPPPITEPVQEMISISTQTDILAPPTPSRRAPPPPPIGIPSIQLHPPNSAPATPKLPLLPQHFKDFGCQVNLQVSVPTRSIAVQTEEIRVDKRRLQLLPLNLQPSSISSQPPSPEPYGDSRQFSPVPGNLPPRNPRRVTRSSMESEVPSSPPEMYTRNREIQDSYPGNNDDGPLVKDRGSLRRPPRISSLFAGFENASSDDADEFADGDMSDNDYRTALSPSNPSSTISVGRVPFRRVQTQSVGPSSVPEGMELSEVSRPFAGQSAMRHSYDVDGDYVFPKVQTYPTRVSSKPIRQLDKPLTLVTNTTPNAFRRAALIQSGVAAHHGRARSPSVPDMVEPPFPIPTRASSRRPPMSTSAPSDGNRSPTYGRGGSSRGPYRANSIRKTRSAAALPRGGRAQRRQGSRSPPPMSPSTQAPESPRLPYMPNNEVTTPRYMRDMGSSRYKSSHRQQPSTTTANTSHTDATAATTTATVKTSNQATSVVDAIAQTMVGEWMYKYVRRRKSFGVADSNGMDGSENVNGVRHKRWVWLAPYERAVMWSSKQPTSGSALMGKAGRKCKF